MIAPAFTIAQTGHSGSAYVAAVLYACGIRCGHEQWWALSDGDAVDGLDGDSSWLAVTDPSFTDYPGVVFHQVRHPLTCIGSLARHYEQADPNNPYLRRRMAHVFDVAPDEIEHVDFAALRADAVKLAAVTWLTMNRDAAASALFTWRVETFNAAHVMAIAAAVGLDPPDLADVRAALRTVPRDLNAHGRVGLTWSSLSDRCPEFVASGIEAAAGLYGYDVAGLS